MAFVETPAHTAIFAEIKAGKNLQIEAVAGSGKTTTIVAAMSHVPKHLKVMFLAFNSSIAKELAMRCPPHVECRTLNSLGYRVWGAHAKAQDMAKPDCDADKLFKLLRRLGEESKVSERHSKVFGAAAVKLVRFARAMGLIPSNNPRVGLVDDTIESWSNLIDHFDVDLADTDDSFEETIKLARLLLRASITVAVTEGWCDFDDQLYLPFAYNAQAYRFDRIFVDEAQDLSPLQHDLLARCLKTDGVIVAVGDPNQAIYGFRGADAKSLENLKAAFRMTSLPLSVSYRCPKAVVAMAQRIVSHIQAHLDAPEGVVDETVIPARKAEFRAGDAVLCRTAAPTVALAYQLIREKRPVQVLGRDIGQGLTKLVEKLDQGRGQSGVIGLLAKLDVWRSKELARATARHASDAKIASIHDKADCLECLAEGVLGDDGKISDLLALIETLFDGAPSAHKITCSTIHKAKGLEWERVWILNKHLMPHPMARQPWQLQQEQNLIYVAYTRAKSELRFTKIEDRKKK
jgi:DNA helicase-2/ATP-dependent DNA helicase PcrA